MNLSTVLPALYVVNKYAKQFATKARREYGSDNHTSAEQESGRKEALYSVKSRVLLHIHPHASRVDKHQIDGSWYYHFEFDCDGDIWKFHLPVSEFDVSSDRIQEEKTLQSFEKDGRVKGGVSLTLKQALTTLNDEMNINANKHIPAGSSTTQWPFLY